MAIVRTFISRLALAALVAASAGTALAAGVGNYPEPTALPPADGSAMPTQIADENLLLSVARAGTRLVSVGEFGHVLLSDDNGATWRQAKAVPTRRTLTDVSFADDRTGWAVGHGTVVLKTTDGGETWVRQYGGATENEDPLLTVAAIDANRAIAMGNFNFAIGTADGGTTWTEQGPLIAGSEDDLHLNHVFRGAGSTLFVAAEIGTIYRSDDLGQTWSKIETGYPGSFWGGTVLADGTLLITGMRGNIWRSADGGQTFTEVTSGTDQSLSSVTQLADGTVVAAGLSGFVSFSRDNGQSWTSVMRADRKGLAAVAEGKAGELLLFGEAGIARQPATPEGTPQM